MCSPLSQWYRKVCVDDSNIWVIEGDWMQLFLFIRTGTWRDRQWPDNWTAVTQVCLLSEAVILFYLKFAHNKSCIFLLRRTVFILPNSNKPFWLQRQAVKSWLSVEPTMAILGSWINYNYVKKTFLFFVTKKQPTQTNYLFFSIPNCLFPFIESV